MSETKLNAADSAGVSGLSAMKQALEALETNQYAVADTAPHADVMAYSDAIASLRLAIEQAEKQEPVGYFSVNDYGNWEQNESNHGEPFYAVPQVFPQVGPCQTCQALARTVMMDQTGRDA